MPSRRTSCRSGSRATRARSRWRSTRNRRPGWPDCWQVLPEKQREILILRVVVGMSAEETAEAVGSTRWRGPRRAAPRAGAAEGRDHRDGARPCLTSDAGIPTAVTRRSTRSTARTGSSTRSRREQPVYSTDPGEAELAYLFAGWRDEVRTPPLTAPVTPRDASMALRRAVAPSRQRSRTRSPWSGPSRRRCCASAASAPSSTGAGPGDPLYGVRTMLFGEQQQTRDDAGDAGLRSRSPRFSS